MMIGRAAGRMDKQWVLAGARAWPPPPMTSEIRGVCKHCEVPVYERFGILFHLDGLRPCDHTHTKFAEVEHAASN